MLIHRATRRLNHKNIHAAHVLQQLKINFAIGKPLQLGLAQRHSDKLADLLAQRAIRRPAENLEALVFIQLRRALPLRRRLGSIPGGPGPLADGFGAG